MNNHPEGFTFQATRDALVTIWHHGRKAVQLKGKEASKFLAFTESASGEEIQHRMARLTGNYKRGNEKKGNER